MRDIRRYLWVLLLGLVGLTAPARAESIHEPNNSPAAAAVLPSGQWVVSDDLNGNAGRPDTILGQFDPAYHTLMATSDNAPSAGNGLGSQLTAVPLNANGSAYFSVTGAPDNSFDGTHIQFGQYSVLYEVYNPAHEMVKSLSENEWVTPGMVDNVWLDPDGSLANWTGYTVDVTVNNLVGPGSGDSLDFFLFTGLDPFQPFTARMTASEFDAIIALFDSFDTLLETGELDGGVLTLVGQADALGHVKIGVTGLGDNDFLGAHAAVGLYTLELEPVPEPSSAILLGAGTALLGLYARRRHRIRRRHLRRYRNRRLG